MSVSVLRVETAHVDLQMDINVLEEHEDGGSMFRQNGGTDLQVHVTSVPRKPTSTIILRSILMLFSHMQ
jgi:hypothetical protein